MGSRMGSRAGGNRDLKAKVHPKRIMGLSRRGGGHSQPPGPSPSALPEHLGIFGLSDGVTVHRRWAVGVVEQGIVHGLLVVGPDHISAGVRDGLIEHMEVEVWDHAKQRFSPK